jgi:hypothetical protein
MAQPDIGGTSPIAGRVLPLQKAEELLQSLTEVVSARIVADATGGVDAIHVLVTGDLPPKQMVRNIESALMAQLGMRVDHRKISIATTVRKPEPTPHYATPAVVVEPPREAPRAPEPAPQAVRKGGKRGLYFEDVEIRGSRAKGMVCRVTLMKGTEAVVGEAEGFESDRSRVELSARATLSAVSLVEGSAHQLSLEGVKVLEEFGREIVMVAVMVRKGRGSALMTGSCEIRDSAETAAALAVLNATNRWVEGVI